MAEDGLTFRLYCLLAVLVSINGIVCTARDEDRKVYIVYMGSLPTDMSGKYSLASHQLNLLQEVVAGDESAASASLLRSYKRSFNGFAAKLNEKEAQKLASKEQVLSVFPSQIFQLQTTRSWDFIGVPKTANRRPAIESNTIIGVLDTGAYPMSESFSDKGFGPPPKKWKGSCKGGANFSCNNKLIGARYYFSGSKSAVDGNGHGTHVASTAAGNVVEGANFFGLANGTARGGVPSARIAIYSVCGLDDVCAADAILAAFDDAIADGVDIITASLGGQYALPFDQDVVSIGSFHAMLKGILVTQAAGNSGPEPKTLSNVAPWVLSVAANTIDRQFIAKLVLGDGTILTGKAVNSFSSSLDNSALVFGKQVTSSCDEPAAKACTYGCLDLTKVAGRIVICDGTVDAAEVAAKNASGLILKGGPTETYPLAAVALDDSSFEKLLSYHNSIKDPRGRILKGETAPNPDSLTIASFSSRGPDMITPDIMKPDVSAPGETILAAYPQNVPPTKGGADHRSVKFNVLSGTSMSCPHVAGAAAYVKTFHPGWSPSAIKSALMTTASKLRDGDEFAYGSGQINPTKALDPGLVYEITGADYVKLICSLGYNISALHRNSTCSGGDKNMTQAELNYPSLIFKAPALDAFNLALNRTVTNVGPPESTYKARVVSSADINIRVVPEVLSFKSVSEKKIFTVTISGSKLESGKHWSNEVVWSDGGRNVRTPVIVYTE